MNVSDTEQTQQGPENGERYFKENQGRISLHDNKNSLFS